MARALAGQAGGQVKAEAIHMHFLDPVAQAVNDKILHHRMVGVDGVAHAGEILIVARVVGQDVIDTVINPLETERGAKLVALDGVVEDHIQNDLQPGLVQRPDHLLKSDHLLPPLCAEVAVMTFGRKKAKGVVAPVVAQPLAGFRVEAPKLPLVKLVDGQQFYRGDAQFPEIRDFLDHAGVGAGLADVGAGVAGQAANVGFVNDGFVPGPVERAVALPVKAVIAVDDALGHPGQVRRRRKGEIGPGRGPIEAKGVAEIPVEAGTAG